MAGCESRIRQVISVAAGSRTEPIITCIKVDTPIVKIMVHLPHLQVFNLLNEKKEKALSVSKDKKQKRNSATGNRTPVQRATSADSSH